jgi:hypothetical protein
MSAHAREYLSATKKLLNWRHNREYDSGVNLSTDFWKETLVMRHSSALFLISLLIGQGASALYAQAANPAPVQSSEAAAAPASFKLTEGTDVSLTFDEDISSKTASEGDSVEFVLADDIKVGNVLVAKAGCKAVGEVTNAKKSGMMGKAGELNIRLDYLKVGDVKVKLRGSKGKEGASGTGGAIALTVLFGPIGLIKHGSNIDIKKGTPMKVFVAEDTTLVPAV